MTKRWRWPTVWLLLCLLAVPGLPGSAMAQEAAPDLAAELETEQQRRQQLERRVVELLAELSAVRNQRNRLEEALEGIRGQYGQIEADRLLLVEFRKEVPEDRQEAEVYLERLRALSLQADPGRLGPFATRMMQVAPTYLDWRHTVFPNADARARAFAESGAHGFPTALNNLRNAVLLSASNRLDAFLNLLDRSF